MVFAMPHRTIRERSLRIDGVQVATGADDEFRLFSTPRGQFLTYRGPEGPVRRALQRPASSHSLCFTAGDADEPLEVEAIPVGAPDDDCGETLIFRVSCQ